MKAELAQLSNLLEDKNEEQTQIYFIIYNRCIFNFIFDGMLK